MKQSITISRNQMRAVINGIRCRYTPYPDQGASTHRVLPSDKTCCDHCVLQDKVALAAGHDRCLEGGRIRPRSARCCRSDRRDRIYGYWKGIKC